VDEAVGYRFFPLGEDEGLLDLAELLDRLLLSPRLVEEEIELFDRRQQLLDAGQLLGLLVRVLQIVLWMNKLLAHPMRAMRLLSHARTLSSSSYRGIRWMGCVGKKLDVLAVQTL
jgi:hypothetical protein